MLLRRWCIPLLSLSIPTLFAADEPAAAPTLRATAPPLSEQTQVDAPVPPEVPLTPEEVDAKVPPPKPLNEPPPQKPSAADYFGKGTRPLVITLREAVRQALKNNLDAKIEEAGIGIENARVKNAYGEFDPSFSFGVQRQRLKTPDATDNIRNADTLIRLQDVALASQVVNSGIDAFNSTQQGVANILADIDRSIRAISNQGVLSFQAPTFNYQPQFASRIVPPTFSSEIVTFVQEVDSGEAGFRARTPLGTVFGVTARGNKTRLSFVGDTRDVLPTYGASATFEFRQPLLKDAGTNANLADLRISRKNREAQELTWKFRIEVVLQNVTASYYDMVHAFADLENKGDAITAALKLLAFSHRREQLGFFSPYEVGQVKLQLEEDRTKLFGAKTFMLDRQILLKRQVLPEFNSRDVSIYLPELIQPIPIPNLDIDLLLRTAFSKRTDYKALILNADTENIRLKFAKNQAYPQLDVVGSYGWNGLDRNFSDAADRLAEGKAPQWQLGISGSVPLGGVQGQAQIEAANERKRQAIFRIQQAELDIGLQVRGQIYQIQNTRQALIAAKSTTEVAKSLVQVGLVRMEAGQLSNFELIAQQRRVYEARSVELQYQAALNKAIVGLWLATGTVLDNLGVEYEDTVDERSLWERVTKPPPLAMPYLKNDAKPAPAPPVPKAPKSPAPTPAPKSKQPKAEPPKEEKRSTSIFKPARFVPRKQLWEKGE